MIIPGKYRDSTGHELIVWDPKITRGISITGGGYAFLGDMTTAVQISEFGTQQFVVTEDGLAAAGYALVTP